MDKRFTMDSQPQCGSNGCWIGRTELGMLDIDPSSVIQHGVGFADAQGIGVSAKALNSPSVGRQKLREQISAETLCRL